MSLELSGVTVRLGRREIVSDVSLTARRGELLTLVGPNGAGKTTLLRAAAGLLPFEGRAAWNGEDIAAMRPGRRARILSYLPQGHVAHWPLIARDVVAIGRAPFASSLSRLPAADNAGIEEALALAEATAFADRPVTELSGGERARVMLARALAAQTPLLLADEPTASLDPAHQLGVMELLQSIARGGRVVVAVIHDLLLAARYSDRTAALHDGRLAAFGPPEETLTKPLLRRVFGVESVEIPTQTGAALLPWRQLDE